MESKGLSRREEIQPERGAEGAARDDDDDDVLANDALHAFDNPTVSNDVYCLLLNDVAFILLHINDVCCDGRGSCLQVEAGANTDGVGAPACDEGGEEGAEGQEGPIGCEGGCCRVGAPGCIP